MDYEYDIFISYTRRNRDVFTWVHEYFYEMFYNKLRSILDREPRIFIDKESIITGNPWENKIRNGLAKSRILLCFYVPDYFRSEWCQKEYWAFQHRQNKLGTESDMSGLIWPIQLADGKHNPPYACVPEILDFYEYFLTSSYFKNSEDYFKMEKRIKIMAEQIAERLERTPEWQNEWIEENWWQDILNQIPSEDKLKFTQPQWGL